MDTFKEQLALLIGMPVLLALIIAEVLFTHFHGIKAYSRKETLTNIYLALCNGTMDVSMRLVTLGGLAWCYKQTPLRWETGWAYWTALFFMEDFAYYALHYVDHHCRLFWAVHVTHHSSEEFNITTGFRSSVFQPLYRGVYFAPLALLGFQPLDIFVMYAATQIWGSFVHTQHIKKLGFIEHILVTPSHHRVHHASNSIYLDKNMGMVLIIWDKLFGTFQEELDEEPVRFGLTKQLPKRDAFNIIFHEWKDILHDLRTSPLPWPQRLGYVFHGPGWKPAASGESTERTGAK